MTTTALLGTRCRERGASMSVAAALLMPCLILAGGLAVDGAQQARARREAHTLAAQASRAGCDEASAAQLVGMAGDGTARARQVAAVAPAGVTMSATVSRQGDLLTVRVSVTRATIVLSAIGVDAVHGHARASCRLVPR
ncbi:hypothetical protein [Acidipropionibacterium jensenii]|uniref:Pilus assembly protein TadE n=1 Tax=Acidipropionibacterium jensenii TaxID=1749 RepID=A0A448NVW8_9ACTN|nr:hypothetical protein [Acidipropionibacterium jensenii]MDN6557396.1 hypothetical protein [Acidipropionibacterium acidipropionici]MDN5976459.1 hypothetical protein [Acidipropionibacterium jensenii]MDN5997464.1 hypothetical protein [Acidipropionibacterium jensenii]MDN6425774.1 hypothetical protein [Acidipropionibacterium jensenii]MDN6440982.1 hypothetical protein [Acidipropionibacterium jensenii]